MIRFNQLPGVRNGEPCPGCGTSIWGVQPKRCFMCGYDFEHPEANTDHGIGDPLEAMASDLGAQMDKQRRMEKEVQPVLETMIAAFLDHEWPMDTSDWRVAFEELARLEWPTAQFDNMRVEAWLDPNEDRWIKHIEGEMILPETRIVFHFDTTLKRNIGATL